MSELEFEDEAASGEFSEGKCLLSFHNNYQMLIIYEWAIDNHRKYLKSDDKMNVSWSFVT
jgi:hypothetical protein